MKKYNKTVPMNTRRKHVYQALNEQIVAGKKNTKEGKVPLNDHDVERIEKEISILKERIF